MDGRRSAWKQRFGKAAEEHAARWLRARGLEILATRYRCREGELDVVASHGGVLIVVEVKARSRRRWGRGAEAVDLRKQRRLVAATRRFLWDRGWTGRPVRFDVVEVDACDGRLEVTWLPDAFRP